MSSRSAAARGSDPRLELPLLSRTPRAWAELAASRLDVFLPDHAMCEQQAALSALDLVAHYPEDEELVERLSALAAEEVSHLRRVQALLRARGLRPARRRPNAYVRGLRQHVVAHAEPRRKTDRLLVCALIEARSCERFTALLEILRGRDPDLERLLSDLGPAERRHWEIFFGLAARGVEPAELDRLWREWLAVEDRLVRGRGRSAEVHG